MFNRTKRKAYLLEQAIHSPKEVVYDRLSFQLENFFKYARRQLWSRLFLIMASVISLAWLWTVACDLFADSFHTILWLPSEKFAVILSAAVAAGLAIAGLYPLLLRGRRYLFETTSVISIAQLDLLAVLGKLTELRGGDTAGHSLRVTVYAALFAEAMNLSPQEFVRTVKGAFLHDIGKLAVPDRILNKTGRLTREERAEIEKHVLHGSEIVGQSRLLNAATTVIRFHHERYDGKGYPNGLKGEAIPLEARLFALIDVFDALTSSRVYKSQLPVKKALDEMAKERGLHFDPALFDRFVELAPYFERKLPHDEAELMSMLIGRLTPYLDLFLLGHALSPSLLKER